MSIKEQEVLEYIADNTNLSVKSQERFKNMILKYREAIEKIKYMSEFSEKYAKMSLASLMKALPALMTEKNPLSFGFY